MDDFKTTTSALTLISSHIKKTANRRQSVRHLQFRHGPPNVCSHSEVTQRDRPHIRVRREGADAFWAADLMESSHSGLPLALTFLLASGSGMWWIDSFLRRLWASTHPTISSGLMTCDTFNSQNAPRVTLWLWWKISAPARGRDRHQFGVVLSCRFGRPLRRSQRALCLALAFLLLRWEFKAYSNSIP